MYRKKEKSRSGCTPCRIRRKKCDEHKPICHACERLRLPCAYEGLTQNKRKPTSISGAVSSALSDVCIQTQSTERLYRVGDFSPQTVSKPAPTEGLWDVFDGVRDDYAQVSSQQADHVIIAGVCSGWQTVLIMNKDDMVPVYLLSSADRLYTKIGHGQVARMAILRIFHMVSQVWAGWLRTTADWPNKHLFSKDVRKDDKVKMPSWLLPRYLSCWTLIAIELRMSGLRPQLIVEISIYNTCNGQSNKWSIDSILTV